MTTRAAGERERLQREAERLLEAVNELDKSGWAQTADYLALFHEALREAERRGLQRVIDKLKADPWPNAIELLVWLEQQATPEAAPGREGKEAGR